MKLTAAALLITLVGGVGLVAGTAPAPTLTAGATPRPPGFHGHASNPFFPLEPGTVAVLRGRDGHQRFRERVVVTHRTKVVQGVRARVVRDVVRRLDGTLAERTHDWYATDDTGRVWYFGEATATYDRHEHLVDREGSWQAGVDGARAGTIMPAHPHVTAAFRQEFQRGEAEDQGWIVQLGAHVSTPAGRYDDAVRSFEWSRLEPGVVSAKFYVRGLGLVSEHDVAGGHEVFRLVRLRMP